MKKLTKENIYINLKGKSNDELTELYGFLKSVGEKIYVSLLDLINNKYWSRLEFYENVWQLSRSKSNKQEVTIQQLKEILQPIENKEQQLKKEAKERGYTNTNFICLMNTKSEGSSDLNKWYYYESMDILFTNEKGLGGMAVYKDGVWAELSINLSLQQQLEQAEAEVNRIKELIKEESNPKVGDWCYFYDNDYKQYKTIGKLTEVTKYYYIGQFGFNTAEKIINPYLIEILEKETKLYNTNHN